MTPLRECSVEELRAQQEGGTLHLLDVREYPEFVEGHVAGARCVPLSALRRDPAAAGLKPEEEVYVLCRTGKRAREAAELLVKSGQGAPIVVRGGVEAWRQAGHPLRRERGPISLERQVRIAAGALVLMGLLVPGLGFLPYIVGAGLIVAGVTNTCAMGLLLARLPWNRPKAAASAR